MIEEIRLQLEYEEETMLNKKAISFKFIKEPPKKNRNNSEIGGTGDFAIHDRNTLDGGVTPVYYNVC